jgi:DNA-binding transcriptional ArsR family regulator
VVSQAIDGALVALSHPVRRELIRLCTESERSVAELSESVRLRQPATSQHLRVLRDAGLVVVRVDGNRRFYQVDFARLGRIRSALDDLWGSRLSELKRAAEARARPSATSDQS